MNPAALPDTKTQQIGTPDLDQARATASINVVRKRVLTPAGTFIRVPVPASVLTVTINFATPEADFRYGVLCTPNFPAGSVYTSVKNTGNCVINFTGTSPADGSGRFDVFIFRSENPNYDGT